MKKLYCLIALLIACKVCEGQNLVPNPSFEIYSSCPNGVGQIDSATGWTSFSQSCDYYNVCADSSTLVNVPYTAGGYQWPSTGNAFCGIICYATTFQNYREIIGCHLTSPLQVGTNYYFSFKVNLAYGGYMANFLASNKLGIKFTTIPYSETNLIPIDNNPHFYINSFILDSVNWTTISGSYIADSVYQYMAIGNFFDSAQTDTMHLGSFIFRSYYYIDDVCISTDSLTCNSTVGINEVKNETEIVLFPNPFDNKLNITVKRNELVEVYLYDVTARKIFSQSFTNSVSINTEQLVKGIYIYELRSKNGTIKKGKVVKE